MNDTLQHQLVRLGFALSTPAPQRVYALPNGSTTSDYATYKRAWLWEQLQRNVTKCHCAGKLKFCAGRL